MTDPALTAEVLLTLPALDHCSDTPSLKPTHSLELTFLDRPLPLINFVGLLSRSHS